jgi:hypothetical protein
MRNLYLQRVLEKIADLPITRIHEMLPWNFAASQTYLGSSQVSRKNTRTLEISLSEMPYQGDTAFR